jgi:glycosyltransferase involved in cell wall biosynthesis
MAARPDTLRAVTPAAATPEAFVPPVLVGPTGRAARIALVHDWLDLYYGSERVVEQILACFPEADVFALVDFMPEEERGFLRQKKVATSFIQRLPFARRHFRRYLPLMPIAIEQFDFGAYDLVLTSSHAIAKGVITSADQPHIAYVYTPMRYAWEFQHEYLRQGGLDRGIKGIAARYMLHRLRLWDARTANGVDQFIATSHFIARRIQKVYRRDSLVVHPPVDVEGFPLEARKDDYYLAVGRFVPYKHLHTIVRAFARLPGRRLVVIGEGDGLKQAQREAPANVSLLGRQPAAELRRHMQRAKALIFAAEEDFGITPLEAQAAGTPVIAYAGGGALETVRGPDQPQPTGLFFEQQTPEAIAAAIERFERDRLAISPQDCRDNALAFAPERFRQAYLRAVIEVWRRHGGRLSPETMTRLARAALANG